MPRNPPSRLSADAHAAWLVADAAAAADQVIPAQLAALEAMHWSAWENYTLLNRVVDIEMRRCDLVPAGWFYYDRRLNAPDIDDILFLANADACLFLIDAADSRGIVERAEVLGGPGLLRIDEVLASPEWDASMPQPFRD